MQKDKNPNMVVAVRVRPDTAAGRRGADGRTVLRVVRHCAVLAGAHQGQADEHMIVFDPSSPLQVDRPANNLKRAKDEKYIFDRVYDASATQTDVYEGTARGLLESVMSGYNATVFAYGATGSGKTHTMIGNAEAGPGVMVLTIRDMFTSIEAKRLDYKYRIVISYLEVYNETIRDLLVPMEEQRPLDLWEDREKGCTVARLSEHEITSAEGVLELLEQGNARRRQSPTEQNATSSRSHAVLQIRCEATDRTADVRSTLRIGKLSLIDLAGSERAATSKNVGNTQLEGANINKSLLALGNCINALCEDPGSARYVPYRNSKLTRLLRDSLGGNCRTVMIATVSPAPHSYEDTHNTLKYANRAKNIKMRAVANEVKVDAHVADYKRIIDDLRAQCAELRSRLHAASAPAPELEKDALRQALHRALEERAGLRREVAQLVAQEAEQSAAMERHRLEVSRWEGARHAANATSPTAVGKARAELRAGARLLQQLGERRVVLAGQLAQSEKEWERLEEEIARVPWPARREQLQAEARLCSAEAERNELRREVSAAQAELSARSEREARLRERVAYLEAVVAEQQHLLADRAVALRPAPLSPAKSSLPHSSSTSLTSHSSAPSSSSSSSSSSAIPPPSLPSSSSSSSSSASLSSSESRTLRFAAAPRSPVKEQAVALVAQNTPSALPLRSALKKTAQSRVASPAEALGERGHAAFTPPSYAQGTLSSLQKKLRQQRMSAEAAQKENEAGHTARAVPASVNPNKLFNSLQVALKEKHQREHGRRIAGM